MAEIMNSEVCAEMMPSIRTTDTKAPSPAFPETGKRSESPRRRRGIKVRPCLSFLSMPVPLQSLQAHAHPPFIKGLNRKMRTDSIPLKVLEEGRKIDLPFPNGEVVIVHPQVVVEVDLDQKGGKLADPLADRASA